METPQTSGGLLWSELTLPEIGAHVRELPPQVVELFAWECAVWACQQERSAGRSVSPLLRRALVAARQVMEGKLAPSALVVHRGAVLGLAGSLRTTAPFASLRRSLCWIVAYVCTRSEQERGLWQQRNLRDILYHLYEVQMHWERPRLQWAGERLEALIISLHRLRGRICTLLMVRQHKLDTFVPAMMREMEDGLFS